MTPIIMFCELYPTRWRVPFSLAAVYHSTTAWHPSKYSVTEGKEYVLQLW